MAPLIPSSSIIAEAEQLVLNLKDHSGSPTDQSKAVRQLEKLRCLLHTGPDALMYQAYPVGSPMVFTFAMDLIKIIVPDTSSHERIVRLLCVRRSTT
jgi:hypothetical protein